MRRAGLALAFALPLLTSGTTSAEIFKCVGPNGEVTFTSSAAQCPNAQPHVLKDAAVQRIEKAEPLASARPGAAPLPRRAPAAAVDDSAGAEALWRNKKSEAQQRLQQIEAELQYLQAAVRWCNEGNLLWAEDRRTGIRRDVPCSEVDATKAALDEEKDRAEDYLAEGLEEECRRAGCLPGWLRD
ncbi:MAG TPA: DUF4124 domain-containing protein [Myxococcota bacterium]|nr:DUF4124 domain-containing protein [Myxococcota bacterium]